MSNVTRLVGAVSLLVVILLGHKLGLSVGWAVVVAVLVCGAVWSAAAWAASRTASEDLKTQTFEMALVSLVGVAILPFVGLGRLLHDGLGASTRTSVWTSIGAGFVVVIAGLVVYYKIDNNRPPKPKPRPISAPVRTEAPVLTKAPAPVPAKAPTPVPTVAPAPMSTADFVPDFTVQVEDDDEERHYSDLVYVSLNEGVPVVCVPDVSAVGPPWRPDVIPARLDPATTAVQVRMMTLVASQYVITPNDRHAGTIETFDHPADLDYGAGRSVLFYVTGAEFSRYVDELRAVRALRPADADPPRASELGGYQVIDFLRRRVVKVCAEHSLYAKVLGAGRWPR